MIQENISAVREKIRQACQRAGRNPDDVTLIAVSKTKPISMIQEALKTGILDYGENKVQEIGEKAPVLPEELRWHMIGHLQRNKVRQVVGRVCLIHSVDSIRLAEQIEAESAKMEKISEILLEVNIAREESKYGFLREEVMEAAEIIGKFRHLRVKGLMTIAPFVENPEQNRPVFENLYDLSVDIKSKNIDNVSMSVLSMGMTNDYTVAIEEGATMIRVGTGIFGVR